MLPRVLEPEVMDSAAEARNYDAMDHSQVNRVFVSDLLAFCTDPSRVLDVGTGTGQIPIELCRQHATVQVVGIDLAEHMLELGRVNVLQAGLDQRIRLEKIDAKKLPYLDGSFAAVMSNSIVHHIPQPSLVLAEMVRVTQPGGALFVRDLLRRADDAAVRHLVQTYAGQENDHQRQMFEDSLRAALTLEEIQDMVLTLGFPRDTVRQTTDRHWTWTARK